MIKIVIADDHALIREGLNRILSFEDEFEILNQASNGKEVLEIIEKDMPNVVLLDINMPNYTGLDALKRIKEKYKNIKVVMLTVENDEVTINKAIDLGADGYVLKESAGSEITNAIRTVYNGEKYIDKSLIKILFKKRVVKENKGVNPLDKLTKRELDILIQLSQGLKNKEIADKLFLSEKTIKNYITSIFRKLEVEDRVQATIFAIDNNIKEYYI